MKRQTLTTIMICLAFFASAQPGWQWGKAGGSRYSTDLGNNPITEWITSMATDPNGNVYALANIARDKAYIGKDSSKPFNNPTVVPNYVFMSWACDGRLRWIKTIGPANVRELATDTLGGVYMIGNMNVMNGNNFDTDTIIAPQGPNVWNDNFIIKYDTSGHVKWLRMPDPNIVTTANLNNRPGFYHIQAAPNGDLHILSYLPTGAHVNGAYSVAQNGVHILKYNKDGIFTGGTRLQVNVPQTSSGPDALHLFSGHFNRDTRNGRYYLSSTIDWYSYFIVGAGNDTLRGGKTKVQIFVTSFDAFGNLKWIKTQDTSNLAALTTTAIDGQGRFYLGGQITNGASWNGTPIVEPQGTPYYFQGKLPMGFIACMDSNGVNKWVSTCYDTLYGGAYPTCLAISKNNVVKAGGTMGSRFTWGAHNIYDPTPQPCSPLGGGFSVYSSTTFLASLDYATGSCTGLNSFKSKCGYSAGLNAMVADRNDNFFIGGLLQNRPEVNDTVTTIGPDKLITIGGTSDFFVAKYGVSSCKATPAPSGISNTPALSELKLYPNPTSSTVSISGISNKLSYTLYNNVGSSLLTGNLSNNPSTLNVAMLPPGFYYIQLRDDRGSNITFKIVKE